MSRIPNNNISYLVCAVVAWSFFLFVLLSSAWLAEDIFITFRAVLNFVNGHGPNWNVGERVQVYTHPLWFLMLSAVNWVSGYLIFPTLFFSIFFSITGLCILQKISLDRWVGVMLLVVLSTSRAFVEFSSSGLENSLGVCLLAVYVWLWIGSAAMWKMSLVTALLVLCRQDLSLLVFPSLCYLCWLNRNNLIRNAPGVVIAAIPLIAWLLFSFIYYGSIFPNTYYAKLPTGVSWLENVTQASVYFLDSITQDLTTALLLYSGIFIGLFVGNAKVKMLAIGNMLYLVYLLWIGGDYMSGRFFMIPVFLSAVMIALTFRLSFRVSGAVAALSIGINLCMSAPIVNNTIPPRGEGFFPYYSSNNIIHERLNWWPGNGFLVEGSNLVAWEQLVQNWNYNSTKCVIPQNIIGAHGLLAGPEIHIIDVLGLADPLLAKLPPVSYSPGHYSRKIPRGYIQSISTGENQIADPDVARLYDVVSKVTSKPLWEQSRLNALLELHSKDWVDSVSEYYLDENSAQFPPVRIYIFPFWVASLRDAAMAGDTDGVVQGRDFICSEIWEY